MWFTSELMREKSPAMWSSRRSNTRAAEHWRWPVKNDRSKLEKEVRKMAQSIDQRDMKQFDRTDIISFRTHTRTRSIASLFALVLTFCVGPVLSQEPSGKDLRVFYQQNCSSCHGPDGSAVSAEGKKLRGQDLTDPDWQSRTRDDEMVKIILKGKFFGLAMPGFKDTLTEDEVQRMVTDIIRKSRKGQVIAQEAERADGSSTK